MKKIIATAALLITLFVCHSQEAKQAKPLPQGKTFNLDIDKDKESGEVLTTNKATYKGKLYPVYTGKRGGIYIKLVSDKTGKEYRKYIKQD